jgi:hypothetical protein
LISLSGGETKGVAEARRSLYASARVRDREKR